LPEITPLIPTNIRDAAAADCERALRLTIDPVYRENLANIREFWISLANARPFLSEGDFVKQAEAIGRFHANL